MRPKVLFVCIENSGRSQMGEGFSHLYGKDIIEAWSAGSKPSGKINPMAIQVMNEKGIDLSGHTSKGLNELPKIKWDYVFTMGCGDACPIIPTQLKEDWAIPDPKHLPLEEFRKIRDQIEKKVIDLIAQIKRGPHHV